MVWGLVLGFVVVGLIVRYIHMKMRFREKKAELFVDDPQSLKMKTLRKFLDEHPDDLSWERLPSGQDYIPVLWTFYRHQIARLSGVAAGCPLSQSLNAFEEWYRVRKPRVPSAVTDDAESTQRLVSSLQTLERAIYRDEEVHSAEGTALIVDARSLIPWLESDCNAKERGNHDA
jgi:hypothetical protein